MAVLASDSFNRVNSTSGLGTTDSYAGGTAYNWSTITGGSAVWGISSNQAYTPTSANDSPAVVDIGQSDNIQVQADLAVTSGIYPTGIAFRVSGNNNYFRCYASTANVKVDRMLNGTLTNIVNQNFTTVTTPFTLAVSISGSTFTVYINGSQVATITDTNLSTNTKHGLYIGNGTSPRLDNFQISSTSGTTKTQTFSDSVTVADNTIAKSVLLFKSDSISFLDSLSKQITKVLTDSQSFSDTITRLITKTLTDSITSSDSFSQSKLAGVKTQTLTDTLTLSDNFVKRVIKGLSDSQTITDAVSKYLSVSKPDNITLSDVIQSGLLFSRSYSDSVSLSDSINRRIEKGFTDNVSIADAITKYLQKTFSDNIIVTDSIQTHLPNAPTLIGTITLSGNIVLNVYLKGDIATNIYLKGGYDVTQENQNFEMYVGETKKVNIPVTNQDGTSANLTGSTIKWVLKKYVTSATDLITKTTTSGGITVSNGTLTVNLVSADTQNVNIVPGNYYHQATLTDAQGDVSVLTTGTCNITASGT